MSTYISDNPLHPETGPSRNVQRRSPRLQSRHSDTVWHCEHNRHRDIGYHRDVGTLWPFFSANTQQQLSRLCALWQCSLMKLRPLVTVTVTITSLALWHFTPPHQPQSEHGQLPLQYDMEQWTTLTCSLDTVPHPLKRRWGPIPFYWASVCSEEVHAIA